MRGCDHDRSLGPPRRQVRWVLISARIVFRAAPYANNQYWHNGNYSGGTRNLHKAKVTKASFGQGLWHRGVAHPPLISLRKDILLIVPVSTNQAVELCPSVSSHACPDPVSVPRCLEHHDVPSRPLHVLSLLQLPATWLQFLSPVDLSLGSLYLASS
jgi:hypothetical protein